ncbi:MAG: arginine--tRNA ligase, partial [Candidatus Korarchaeota archaeon]
MRIEQDKLKLEREKIKSQEKIAKESEGAKILEFENLPAVILEKSDKTTTYFARDLATLFWRIKKFSPSLILYVVGTEQTLHFQQLFETAKILNLTKKTKLFHLAHGLYLFEGKKFSTRKGKTIHFEDILKEGIEKTKKIIETSKTKKYSKKEEEKIAKILTLGAIKY